jgi:hypothetical protein
MSHIVTIKTQIRDPVALAAACTRLGLPQPTRGTARLFNGGSPGWSSRRPAGTTRSS